MTDNKERDALSDLLAYAERTICYHEETHRGGGIWTICDSCGQKWADDEGGFQPAVVPEEIIKARAALAASQEKAEPVSEEAILDLAQRHAHADWGCNQRDDGYIQAVKAIVADALSSAAPVAAHAAHPDDAAVDRFAAALKEKLAIARGKGRSGWENMDPAELSLMLREHVEKGDPRDVANFCMFLWALGEPIGSSVLPYGKRAVAPQPSAAAVRNAALEEVEQLCAQQTKFWEEAARAEESVGPLYHSACAKAAQSVFIKDRVHSLKSQSAPPQPAEQPNAAPADEWEIRNDGKRVRKDRWETGIRNIVTIMGGVREEFEVPEVVETIRKLLTGDAKGPVLSWFTFPSASPFPLFESGYALTDEEITKLAESMPGGLEGFLKGWGWQNFARAVESEVMLAIARAQGEQA